MNAKPAGIGEWSSNRGWASLRRIGGRQTRPLMLLLQMLLSSGLGWLFSRALARQYGLCQDLDGFLVAHNFAYLGWNLFGFAIISGVLTLLVAEALAVKTTDLPTAYATLMTLTLSISGGCLAISCVWSEQLAMLFAPGLAPEIQAHMASWIRILSPLVATVAISGLWSAILAGHTIPFSSELNSVVGRILVLILLLGGPELLNLHGVCSLLVLGSLVSLVGQYYVFRRATGLTFRPTLDLGNIVVRRFLKHSVYFMLAAIAMQTCDSQLRRLTTLADPGTSTAVGLCFSVYTPLSVVLGRLFAFAYGPTYVALKAQSKLREAQGLLIRGSMYALLSCGGLAWMAIGARESLVALLFGGGQIDRSAVERTANLLAPLLLAVPSVAIQSVLFAAGLGARKAHFMPVIWTVVSSLQVIAMSLIFPRFGTLGIMWCYALASYGQLAAILSAIAYIAFLENRQSCGTTGIP